MSPTHIWVIERLRGDKWRFVVTVSTREEARYLSKFVFVEMATRIRKYVPV